MHSSTLIIGGCRSGKSAHALNLAETTGLTQKLFIATCVAQDKEMQQRVERHQLERGPHWQTVEAPEAVTDTIAKHEHNTHLIVVDCLTLWMSNIMLSHQTDDEIHRAIDALCQRIQNLTIPIILVSNEVGNGIVPENALARRYRDLVGRTNQKVAAACQQVMWMVAGIPVSIKP